MKESAWQMLKSSLFFAKKFGKGQWSFFGPGSEKKWYCISEDSPQGIWDHIAEKILVEFAESGCPIFRATTPLSRGKLKAKDTENCRFTLLPTKKTIETKRHNRFCKSAQSLRSSRKHV